MAEKDFSDRVTDTVLSKEKSQFPSISAVIVTWNSEDYITDCLSSLEKELHPAMHEVYVIDNNSSDKTASIVKKKFPFVRMIQNKDNKGFGAANNQGIRKASGDYILLLNPDTIVHPGSIFLMTSYLQSHARVGMVGPEQINGEGKILFNFSRYTLRGLTEYITESFAPKSLLAKRLRRPYEVPYLNGGCWLARKAVFTDVGLFDEKLFLYGEEPDMCQRIRTSSWQIHFVRNAMITHFREGSMRKIGVKKYFHALRSFSHVLNKGRSDLD
ncbi:MAG TPA: glycosyltransferase family 2 protein [Patescibacteria group bacterium]|nr:glycosyltransferase family 2 protein [Patescibacteria group bacterium]